MTTGTAIFASVALLVGAGLLVLGLVAYVTYRFLKEM